jgi:hypothetical protein
VNLKKHNISNTLTFVRFYFEQLYTDDYAGVELIDIFPILLGGAKDIVETRPEQTHWPSTERNESASSY